MVTLVLFHCLNSIPDILCLFVKGLELLYQPEVVRLYLSLLTCSHNHNTLEAAAGALQNLAAGHWTVSGLNNYFLLAYTQEFWWLCVLNHCLWSRITFVNLIWGWIVFLRLHRCSSVHNEGDVALIILILYHKKSLLLLCPPSGSLGPSNDMLCQDILCHECHYDLRSTLRLG